MCRTDFHEHLGVPFARMRTVHPGLSPSFSGSSPRPDPRPYLLAPYALTAPKIPLSFLPEVDFPSLEISIPYPNALPAQVYNDLQVTWLPSAPGPACARCWPNRQGARIKPPPRGASGF